MYNGSTDTKSIIPNKLNIYFAGFFAEITLKRYSTENNIVNNHSMFNKTGPYARWTGFIVSRITAITLIIMAKLRMISKTKPSEVVPSKILSRKNVLNPLFLHSLPKL